MNVRKIIIFGIILAIVIGGAVWYFDQGVAIEQPASIAQNPDTQEQPEENQEPDQRPDTIEEVEINYQDQPVVVEENYQDPFLGDANAPVTIIEYFSYGCGHCRTFHQETLPALKQKYIDSGQVRYMAYQVFGISQFPEAALCAGEQGRFWQYHDYLFNHGTEITKPEELYKLIEFAEVLGLDIASFNDCMSDGRYKDKIADWISEGKRLNLSGVPVFYVNGERLVGSQPLSKFEEFINK